MDVRSADGASGEHIVPRRSICMKDLHRLTWIMLNPRYLLIFIHHSIPIKAPLTYEDLLKLLCRWQFFLAKSKLQDDYFMGEPFPKKRNATLI